MTYKDYFEELNLVICDFSNDEITENEATDLIDVLNQRAAKGDNSTLVKFLVNSQNEIARASKSKFFEEGQPFSQSYENSYDYESDESDEESFDSSYE